MIVGKAFSKELSDDNDDIAKSLIVDLLTDIYGDNEFRYNLGEQDKSFNEGFWDVAYKFNGQEYKFEVEMKDKKFWTGIVSRPFRFNTMDITGRKEKHKKNTHAFVLFSTDLEFAFIVKRSILDKYGSEKLKPNIYSNGELELFMTIDIKHGKFYHKGKDGWGEI